ncbi:RDD family protein [Luteimonas marina]|uniref:RDD family protein n=1 Tax=Luteimonas marina TaxID=488485 RepID=A0A5C5TXG9_9GAMM|nr:RDD family protein [Luteimonas marina]TWT18098.1 RDD family protein [Luteimonas marina]
MPEWYYADAANARQGPVDAAALVRLRLQGQLGWETLVWREGMADWRPMRDFAAELAQADDRGPLLSTADGSVVDAGHTSDPPPASADPASPYAPPTAAVSSDAAVVLGGEIVHAGFWKRFAAMVIDGFITAAASWVVQIPLLMLAAGAGMMGGDMLASGGAMGIIVLSYGVGILIPLFYFAWMHSSGSQASLGKLAVGIKVTRGSGERISFWRAFARYAAYFATVVFSFGIGGLVSAFTTGLGERRQALHDMICDTLVVDRWAFTDRPDLQRRELGVVTWVVIVIGGGLLGLGLLGIVAAIAIPALTR